MADNIMTEWMVVYADPTTEESTHQNVWSTDMEGARAKVLEENPDITRVIGVYVAKSVGCTEKYAGEAGPEPDTDSSETPPEDRPTDEGTTEPTSPSDNDGELGTDSGGTDSGGTDSGGTA